MHKGVPAQGLQILAAPSSMDARSVWILLGKKAHPSLAYIWTDMPVTCVLPYEKQLAGQKSLSAKYCKLIQNNIHLKAPGYTVRKHSRYSKQIIFFAYKGAATWSNHHSWQEHRTECQESWPCHFKGDPGHVFLGFNIHLFNKYLLSDCHVLGILLTMSVQSWLVISVHDSCHIARHSRKNNCIKGTSPVSRTIELGYPSF